LSGELHFVCATQLAKSIKRLSGSIEHSAKQLIANCHLGNTMGGHNACARHQPTHIARRHQKQFLARKAHDFGFNLLATGGVDQTPPAYRSFTANSLKRHANHSTQRTFDDELAYSGDSHARALHKARESL
jgi:hypothetical protein